MSKPLPKPPDFIQPLSREVPNTNGLDGPVDGVIETAKYCRYDPVSLSYELIQCIYLKDPEWDPATLNQTDYPYFWAKDPFGLNAWNGDLSPFRNRGGKVITYHGQMDSVITSGISETYYEQVSRSMQSSPKELDKFYRFFRIGGINHCALGPGAWNFGQSGPTVHMDADHNVLAAIVRWVEQGIAPETLTGTKYVNDTVSLGEESQRKHCRYPLHNVYKGGDSRIAESWSCVE